MANKKVIIDNRMRQIEKQKLQNMGYEIIEIQTSPNVYTEISSHVDIFACKIENEIIVEPTQNINNISNKIGLVVNSKAKNVWDFIKTLFIS